MAWSARTLPWPAAVVLGASPISSDREQMGQREETAMDQRLSLVTIDPDGHPWEVAHNPAWTVHEDGRTTID